MGFFLEPMCYPEPGVHLSHWTGNRANAVKAMRSPRDILKTERRRKLGLKQQ